MSIGRTAIEKLDNLLADQKRMPEGGIGKCRFDQRLNHLHLRFAIEDFDKFSYLLDEIRLKALDVSDTNLDFAVLEQRAKTVIAKLTYLVENLSVVEADQNSSKIQIRSLSPEKKEGVVTYFEIILEPNSLTFARIQSNQEGLRVTIPFQLTKEVFERLVNDLADILRK